MDGKKICCKNLAMRNNKSSIVVSHCSIFPTNFSFLNIITELIRGKRLGAEMKYFVSKAKIKIKRNL